MKRQRGRGRKPGNNNNRTFESNGPDVKVRGNASHIHDKYQQLARDAMSSGDRVMAENYFQHAEHYLRIVNANQQQRQRDDQQQGGGDQRGGSQQGGGQQGGDPQQADNQGGQTQRDQNQGGQNQGGHNQGGDGSDNEDDGRNRRRRGRRRGGNDQQGDEAQAKDQGRSRDQSKGGSRSDDGGDPLAVVNPEGGEGQDAPASGFESDQDAEKPRRRSRRKPAADPEAEAALKQAGSSDADSSKDDAGAQDGGKQDGGQGAAA